jgi:hypothetical protein
MNAEDLASRTRNASAPSTPLNDGPGPDFRLHRWLVYFASGSDWSGVGEFVAADATSAIERAVEVFGQATAYRAEQVPWDAAPLWRAGM